MGRVGCSLGGWGGGIGWGIGREGIGWGFRRTGERKGGVLGKIVGVTKGKLEEISCGREGC